MDQQSQSEMIIRMECLKLACATAGTSETGADTIKKADVFVNYVSGLGPKLLKPKIVTN